MTKTQAFLCAALTLALFTSSGCLQPRRGAGPIRSYILSSLPAADTAPISSARDYGLGIAPVQIPGYLSDTRLVVRKDQSEIRYLEHHRWAERLDRGIQRVLGDDLSLLLGSDRVVLSAWSRPSIQAELYVTVQRFEVDEQGQVLLEARWRLAGPGGEPTLLTRRSQIRRPGPAPATHLTGTVGELSAALGELSREIALAVGRPPEAEGPKR